MINKLPILIFKGDSTLCYGILKSFSEQLRDAFIEIGEEVIFVDPDKAVIEDYIGNRYKAVILFMETLVYSQMPNTGEKVFDLIDSPIFNFWFDHPSFYYKYVKKSPRNYYILTQDRNYVSFINRYYHENAKAFFLPPGGRKTEKIVPFSDRKFDISFVGTYINWRDTFKEYNLNDATTKIIVDKYIDKMVHNPDMTTTKAFAETLNELGASVTDGQFIEALATSHKLAVGGVAKLYREEVIRKLLEAGLIVDVFGDSWKKAPFVDNPYLNIHTEVSADSISEIYKNSKISLNVMSWHKDCITERILDAMMAGCIVVSDQTLVLRENFEDGKEIILFSLNEINKLPEIIKKNIDNESIASSGYMKAIQEHTWENRAKGILSIINRI